MFNDNNIKHAAQLIRNAERLIITAGAGMGVDSGLPDFRGAGGFWRAFPPLQALGLRFEDMATPSLFDTDPALAWGFYGLRLNSYRAVIPHEGFAILRRWALRKNDDCFVFTSNVDGQFQKAGFDEQRIYECHGSIHFLQCARLCREEVWPADGFNPIVDESQCRLQNEPPRCPHCGGLARPNILMFNDGLWNGWRYELQAMRLRDWQDEGGVNPKSTVIIELGAGKAIATVRYFGERLTRKDRLGRFRMIRINPTDFSVGRAVDVGLAGGALVNLQALDAAGAWG